ncbi:MAG: BolA/IbaG family iron-sulfur metabolism protein [Rickettsiales bacterium]|nr:BolA/IbaG family iron-sulfur metabolism protein [Rickettsiales bacterium]
MTPREQQIYDALIATFPSAEIQITDTAGDQDHFRIAIQHPDFTGLSRIAQQRAVFNALGPLGQEIHAIEYQIKGE